MLITLVITGQKLVNLMIELVRGHHVTANISKCSLPKPLILATLSIIIILCH